MEKKLKKVIFTILFIIAILLLTRLNSQASTLSIDTSKSTVTPGETFSVTVKVSGGAGKVNITVNNGTGATSQFIDNTSYSFNCKAGNSGNVSISASGTIADYNTEKDESKSASKTVTIKSNSNNTSNNSSNSNNKPSSNNTTSTKKSNDATLKTLGVRPSEYDFSNFSKNKTEYSVTIPYNIDKLTVSYATSNKGASVKVSGNTNLVVGTSNKINVVVTAEDGTKKTYTIKVTKLAKEDEKEGNVIEPKENEDENNEQDKPTENKFKLEKLIIKNFNLSPEFSEDIYTYKIDIDMDKNDIDKLELEYAAKSEDAKIEVIGNENLKEGENVISIIVSGNNEEDKAIYQIIVNKVKTVAEVANLDVSDTNTISKIKIILFSSLAGIIILIIGIIILIHFREKKLNEDEVDSNNKQDTEDNLKQEKEDKDILDKVNKEKGRHF